ncbi:MAG TPA: MFS transporter [Pseudothermotoga sp.]|nr:MFS transporter [Pseudothermotoga sp.]HOK82664.1 MFS transporter [Pseudothermotoga sp.]HPP70425.1 MFS transporter [Pseudothermotoga sp.]
MKDNSSHLAIKFIVLMGFVSLFSDIVYEGARSISGQYLGLLGASATAISITAGLGEFIGYAFRLVSGYFVDRTRRYWLLTFFGYIMNLLVVPVLAFVGKWQIAVLLLIAERFGKAIRKPARDTMMSFAVKRVGAGWGFGLEEALDQIGAVTGPIILSVALALKNGEELLKYKFAFSLLFVPAIISLVLLTFGRIFFPTPSDFEKTTSRGSSKQVTRSFIWYLVAISFIAAGFADFPLIAYHFSKVNLVSASVIPLFYSFAMGIDAVAAVVFGRLFDKKGLAVLIVSSLLSTFFSPLVFLSRNVYGIVFGVSLWGIGIGAQESILKAVVANLVPAERRGTAYGIFNTVFGLTWFLGSLLMGVLYEKSLFLLVIFSVLMEIFAVLAFIAMKKSTQ